MKLYINWDLFRRRYFNQSTIFIYEDEVMWKFLTSDGRFIVISNIYKMDNPEDRMIWINKILSTTQNIIKVDSLEDDGKGTIINVSQDGEKWPQQ